MAKKLPYTPNGRINSALRQLWLRSRERAGRLKMDDYTCQCCGRKQSKKKGAEFKVEVHHRHGVENWGEIYRIIREYLLCSPEKLETLCKTCHNLEGKNELKNK